MIINNLPSRGRIAGMDLFLKAVSELPVDLAGMGTEAYGIGEILHPQLPGFLSRYRFYFHPPRWTSLGLSLLEAMMVGLPVVGVGTTELPMVIQNNVSGYYDTNMNSLVDKMKQLVNDHALASRMGSEAKITAQQKFNIGRFTNDWEKLFRLVIQQKATPPAPSHNKTEEPFSLHF